MIPLFDFSVVKATATIQITRKFAASLSEPEQFIAWGYQEGISVAMVNLENLLRTFSQHRQTMKLPQIQ